MPTDPSIFVTTDEQLPGTAISALACDLAEALGPKRVLGGDTCIAPVRLEDYYLQPDGIPRSAQMLKVGLASPYYGKGYERGYWPEIVATLEFLRRRVPYGRVWYGPDSSDDAWEVTPQLLDEIWGYWAVNGCRPYFQKSR